MNALTTIEQDPLQLPFVTAIAVRMADEGIPVRAIARTTRVSSEDVYQILKDAIGRGVLIELPKDDWPVGSNRGDHVKIETALLESDDALQFACARVFKTTRLEAAILAMLLKRTQATKPQLHSIIEHLRGDKSEETDPKMVDVVICHLRKKLRTHHITIETVWGLGYLIDAAGREHALQKLTVQEIPSEVTSG